MISSTRRRSGRRSRVWRRGAERMLKTVVLFLLIMVAMALAFGPGFRRAMARLLGLRRGR